MVGLASRNERQSHWTSEVRPLCNEVASAESRWAESTRCGIYLMVDPTGVVSAERTEVESVLVWASNSVTSHT
jgi:hypothetical protein